MFNNFNHYFFYREHEKIKILLTEYENVKETEETFQKECEIKMEEYQQKIEYTKFIYYIKRMLPMYLLSRFIHLQLSKCSFTSFNSVLLILILE